jgi:ATPase subunit of ABC transporter with duplicated ATPase domains
MPHIELTDAEFTLSDGRTLLYGITFRLGAGQKAALIGPNGIGKSTLFRIVAGELPVDGGSISRSGSLAVMPQFIGRRSPGQTVRDLLLATAPLRFQDAATTLVKAERTLTEKGGEESQLAYAQALADWGDIGGYPLEALWDSVTLSALGARLSDVEGRAVDSLSGGEQKRVMLEALFAGSGDILLLDEPDNYLDVPGKRWLEEKIATSTKTVLFSSHDRELIAASATRIITLERIGAGAVAWTHGGGFGTYSQARSARNSRLAELRRRWAEEHERLRALVHQLREKAKYNDSVAARYRAAQTRLARFEETGPPEAVPLTENVSMRLKGGRTGKRALRCEHLAMPGLFRAFDMEAFYGDRIAVLGPNGSGKTHFLTLIASEAPNSCIGHARYQRTSFDTSRTGHVVLGARVQPGYFSQTQTRPDLIGTSLFEVLHAGDGVRAGMARDDSGKALARYGLAQTAEQRYEDLSGGQQARFQILLLELSGANMLLLDEPTDNLDLESAESLEQALTKFGGTVIAVTHDRWFARSFDRYLIFNSDGSVQESETPTWE